MAPCSRAQSFSAVATASFVTFDGLTIDLRLFTRDNADWLGIAADLAMQLDRGVNNTSLVLAFEFVASGRVVLFPGDAQVGNWLSWQKVKWPVGTKEVEAIEYGLDHLPGVDRVTDPLESLRDYVSVHLADSDTFFEPGLARRMVDAFNGAGGHATLQAVGANGQEGHNLATSPDGPAVWTPLVESFLRTLR